MDITKRELFEKEKQIYHHEADVKYRLARFGDHLAEREGYRAYRGLDAVVFYIVGKYRWTPEVVRRMPTEDLCFLMKEEMHGWDLPKEAV